MARPFLVCPLPSLYTLNAGAFRHLSSYSAFRRHSIQCLHVHFLGAFIVKPLASIIKEVQFVFKKVLIMAWLELDVTEFVIISEEILPWGMALNSSSESVETSDVKNCHSPLSVDTTSS